MPETQEVVIPSTVRQELLSGVRQLLKDESNELRKVREELKAATKKRTRTAGWREQEARSRRRVELFTGLLTVLQTSLFNPPTGSSLPRILLRETAEKVGFLDQGLYFIGRAYQRAIKIQTEVREILNIWST